MRNFNNRPEGQRQNGIDHPQVDQVEQVAADHVVDGDPFACAVPIGVERFAGGRPLVFRHLQGGPECPCRAVELLGLLGGHLAAQQLDRCLRGRRTGRRQPTSAVPGRTRCTAPGFPASTSRRGARRRPPCGTRRGPSSDPRTATARYCDVVRSLFHGCFIRLPESTLLSTTPWPTSGQAICMTTFAAAAANDQKSMASAAVTGRSSQRAVRRLTCIRQSASGSGVMAPAYVMQMLVTSQHRPRRDGAEERHHLASAVRLAEMRGMGERPDHSDRQIGDREQNCRPDPFGDGHLEIQNPPHHREHRRSLQGHRRTA